MQDNIWISFAFNETIKNRFIKSSKANDVIISHLRDALSRIHGHSDMIQEIIIPQDIFIEAEHIHSYLLGIMIIKIDMNYYPDFLVACLDYPLNRMIRADTISKMENTAVQNIIDAGKNSINTLRNKFKVGDHIIIIDGIEKGIPGIIEDIDDEFASIAYNILGHKIVRKFKLSSIEKYSNLQDGMDKKIR